MKKEQKYFTAVATTTKGYKSGYNPRKVIKEKFIDKLLKFEATIILFLGIGLIVRLILEGLILLIKDLINI